MADPGDDQTISTVEMPLTEVLPTRRVAFGKQLDILRAYGALGSSGQTATAQRIAEVVGLKPDTASLTNSFFVASGLIIRTEPGGMRPAPEVVDFQKAYQWNAETAGHELAPLFEDAWFWQALAPHLALGPVTDAKAMAILGQASNATKHRSVELRLIVEFLEFAGLVERYEGHVRLRSVRKAVAKATAPAQAPASEGSAAPTPKSDLPLLIQGLLQQLPPDGKWTRTQAENWLKMAKLAFEVVYVIEDDSTPAGSASPSIGGAITRG